MAKELAILVVSVVTLFVAGFGAYTINDIGSFSNSQQATAEIKDYTVELELIQLTLNQVSQKLEILESDTVEELQKIKIELEEVKSITVERQKEMEQLIPFGISLDKSTYFSSDSVIITAKNVIPQKPVNIQLLSTFNETIITKTPYSDSAGKLDYTLSLPSFIPSGYYKIKAEYNGNVVEKFFNILDDPIIGSVNEKIVDLTLHLDQDEYQLGDMIKLSGVGLASSPIIAELISPDSETSTANSNTFNDGSYTLIFILNSESEPGTWTIKVSQGDKEETVTFNVEN